MLGVHCDLAPVEPCTLPQECILGLFEEGSYLVSPCLEVCDKDPTLCCLHEQRKHQSTLQAAVAPVESKYLCRVCGDRNPENFYPKTYSICIGHLKEFRREMREKAAADRDSLMASRTCRECGKTFSCKKNSPRHVCQECRKRGPRGSYGPKKRRVEA